MTKLFCGDANPRGNITMTYKGGCRKHVKITEAYRCTGCGGWFHRDCIFEHFERENGQSKAHNALRKILDNAKYQHDGKTIAWAQEGLSRERENKPI